jgi:hypothetical protein
MLGVLACMISEHDALPLLTYATIPAGAHVPLGVQTPLLQSVWSLQFPHIKVVGLHA